LRLPSRGSNVARRAVSSVEAAPEKTVACESDTQFILLLFKMMPCVRDSFFPVNAFRSTIDMAYAWPGKAKTFGSGLLKIPSISLAMTEIE